MPALVRGSRFRSTFALLTVVALAGACTDQQAVLGPDADIDARFAIAPAAPWTGSGPGTVSVANSAGAASLTYSLNRGCCDFDARTWDFTTTASKRRTIAQPWSYSGFHAYFNVTVTVDAVVNGVVVATLLNAGPENCCTTPSAGFGYNGSYTFDVRPGDTYGFRFGGSNYDSNNVLQGIFTVILLGEADCKEGGWVTLGFSNQGLCMQYVNTGKDSR